MKCERCDMEHDGTFGSGKFCSRTCANSRVRSDDLKKKLSEKMKGMKPWNTGCHLSDSHKQKISERNIGKESPLALPNELVFVDNSTLARHHVKSKILKQGLIEYKCAVCGVEGDWNGKPLVLQLEHKNGVNNDNRLENLEFLCPNCHSQTHTYAARNRSNPNRRPK